MLNSSEKKLLFINDIISIVLSIAVVVPYSLAKISGVEILFKYLLIPVVILVLFLLNLSTKYRNYRPANRFATVGCYIPVFSYLAGIMFSSLLLLVRANAYASNGAWLGLVILVACLFIAIAVLSHFVYRAVVIFSKNEMMLIDALIALLFIGDILFLNTIANKYKAFEGDFTNGSLVFLLVPLFFALLAGAFHVLAVIRLYKANAEYAVHSKKELIERVLAFHKLEYDKAEAHILRGLFTYSREQLGIKGYDIEEIKQLKAAKDALEEEVARLQAELDSQTILSTEELLALQKRLAELQIVLAEVQVQYAAQQKELENQKNKFADKELELKSQKAQNAAEQKALEAEKARQAKAEKALDDEKAKQEKAEKALVEEKARYAAEQKVLEAEKARQAKAEKALNEEIAKQEKAEKALAEEKARYAAEQKALAEEKARYAAEQKALEEEKARQEAEQKALEEEKARQEAEQKALEEELARQAEQKALEEAAAAAKLAEAQKPKKAKKFKPAYAKMIDYASALPGLEIKVVANEKGNQHKFYLGKKMFLSTLATGSDYRINFCSTDDDAIKLIVENPGFVIKPTSPKGEEWFRIINKGEQPEKLLKQIIKNAAKYRVDEEAARLAEQEAARQAAIAAKEAAKEAAKAAKEAAKDAEKAAADAAEAAKKAEEAA